MKAIITIAFILSTLYLFTLSNAEESKEFKHAMSDYLKE